MALREELHREHRSTREVEETLGGLYQAFRGEFLGMASDVCHPLWRASVEILCMMRDGNLAGILRGQIHLVPVRLQRHIVETVAGLPLAESAALVRPFLLSHDPAVAEAAFAAVRRARDAQAAGTVREALRRGRTSARLAADFHHFLEEHDPGC